MPEHTVRLYKEIKGSGYRRLILKCEDSFANIRYIIRLGVNV